MDRRASETQLPSHQTEIRGPKLPNFILAGAGEAGSTSLYSYLKQHPQVFMSPVKEPNFFAATDILSLPNFKPLEEGELSALLGKIERGKFPSNQFSITRWQDYLQLFQNVRDEPAVGEASVMYLWFPSAAPTIHRTLPQVRLIFVLRDPAERLYTLYLRTLRTGQRAAFRDWVLRAMETKADRRSGTQRHPVPLDCGLYATHLQPFFELFPRKQIRIYLYESYRADPQAILKDILGFLGVNVDHPIDTSRRLNETAVPRFRTLDHLRQRIFADLPLAKWLPAPMRQSLRRFYYQPKTRLPMTPEDRRMVINYYRDEIVRAQDLIGLDLSTWLR